MAESRATSASRRSASFSQSWPWFSRFQPKAAASSAHMPYSAALTISFFGTQPTLTQVPPQKRSSATATLAQCPAAIRAARTPPEPPPMTKRSKS